MPRWREGIPFFLILLVGRTKESEATDCFVYREEVSLLIDQYLNMTRAC